MLFSYYRRPLFLLLLAYAAVLVVHRLAFPAGPAPFPAEGAREYLFEGRVQEYPVRRFGSWRFEFRADRVNGRPSGAALMAYLPDMGGASYGDTVSFAAPLDRESFNFKAPGSLDWRGYLAGRGIAGEARAAPGETPVVVKRAPLFLRAARALRERTLAVFAAALPADRASVLGGIVLGEKKGVSDGLKKSFQDSGAMHMLVASGSNVGFVTFLVYFLCGRAGLRRGCAGLLALGCAGLYVAAAGLDPPLVRGYIMTAAAFAGYLLDRYPGIFQGLVIACLGIMLFDPRALFDAGFQMSFLAAYGIVAGMALWGPALRLGGLPGKTLNILLVSFFAQAGLYPLMALYFHKVSLVSLLANVALVPASGLLMALGFLCVAASWSSALLEPVAAAASLAVGAFIWLVRLFASLPWASVRLGPPSELTVLAYFVFLFALLHAPLAGFRSKKLYCAAVPALLLALFGTKALPERRLAALFSDRDTFSAAVLGGEGALFLVNPGLDGEKLANAALHYGSRTVEGVFVSTLARKDWSGLAELGGALRIKRAVLPYGPLPDELEKALSGLRERGAEVVRLWNGEAVPFRECSVAAAWRAGFRGYAGNSEREGLDWTFSCGDFSASVEGNGRRLSWKGRTAGSRQAVRGELLEQEL